tara:strand:- start:407 stop:748 length:342 start_codon:yes stop_codon:yes gene_type:complete
MKGMSISWSDFEKIDLRVGTIIEASVNKHAKKAAYILTIDFGELGIKKSSAQITEVYTEKQLVGIQVICVVNFPPKQIAKVVSECLVLGVVNENKGVVLLTTEQQVNNGLKIS